MEKDQLAMAAAKMRKPTPTVSLTLGSPSGLQPVPEGKEEGEEEKEEGGESTSDPFDVSGKNLTYSLSLIPPGDPTGGLGTLLGVWGPY